MLGLKHDMEKLRLFTLQMCSMILFSLVAAKNELAAVFGMRERNSADQFKPPIASLLSKPADASKTRLLLYPFCIQDCESF